MLCPHSQGLFRNKEWNPFYGSPMWYSKRNIQCMSWIWWLFKCLNHHVLGFSNFEQNPKSTSNANFGKLLNNKMLANKDPQCKISTETRRIWFCSLCIWGESCIKKMPIMVKKWKVISETTWDRKLQPNHSPTCLTFWGSLPMSTSLGNLWIVANDSDNWKRIKTGGKTLN